MKTKMEWCDVIFELLLGYCLFAKIENGLDWTGLFVVQFLTEVIYKRQYTINKMLQVIEVIPRSLAAFCILSPWT